MSTVNPFSKILVLLWIHSTIMTRNLQHVLDTLQNTIRLWTLIHLRTIERKRKNLHFLNPQFCSLFRGNKCLFKSFIGLLTQNSHDKLQSLMTHADLSINTTCITEMDSIEDSGSAQTTSNNLSLTTMATSPNRIFQSKSNPSFQMVLKTPKL